MFSLILSSKQKQNKTKSPLYLKINQKFVSLKNQIIKTYDPWLVLLMFPQVPKGKNLVYHALSQSNEETVLTNAEVGRHGVPVV